MSEKHIEAIRLFDLVLATKDIPAPQDGWDRMSYPHMTVGTNIHPGHAAWDVLFEYMHLNFALPETSSNVATDEQRKVEFDLVRPLIDKTFIAPSAELLAMIKSIPPVILEVVFPVAMARYILRDARLDLNHRQLKTFKMFHDRYGTMILGC